MVETSSNCPPICNWLRKNAKLLCAFNDGVKYGFGVIYTYELPLEVDISADKKLWDRVTKAGYAPNYVGYTYGDAVEFKGFSEGVVETGVVCIVDRAGTDDNDRKEPSYDILMTESSIPGGIPSTPCLIKHITESSIIRKVGEVAEKTAWDPDKWEMRLFPAENK